MAHNVRRHSHHLKVVVVVLAQHDTQVTGQALKEQEEEECTGLVTRRANLRQLMEGFLSPNVSMAWSFSTLCNSMSW